MPSKVLASILISYLLASTLSGQTRASDNETIAKQIYQLVNAERKKRGPSPLRYSEELEELAAYHSKNMAYYRFFAHTDKQGMNAAERKKRLLPDLFGVVGENIAYIKTNMNIRLDEAFMKQWMKSPGHRRNILDHNYSYIGVGIARRDDIVYATQVFGDLIASLITDLPEHFPFKSEVELKFKFLGHFPKKQIVVVVQFPDENAKFQLDDKHYYLGHGVYKPKWHGDYFTVNVKFDKGKGIYKLNLGKNGKYYPDGVEILVK